MSPRKIARRWFGPGTAAMFVGIAAFAAYSSFSATSASQAVRYEADRSGELRRVSVPFPKFTPIRIPIKPEPSNILAARLKLKLTRDQVSRLEAVSKRWFAHKTNLERSIGEVAGQVREQGKVRQSNADLRLALAGYSELSREFQRYRDLAWVQALAVLDEPQLHILKSIDPITGDQK